MSVIVGFLWIGVALAYGAFRLRDRPDLADGLLTLALIVFGVTCFFEEEVFWKPGWNLAVKCLAVGAVLVAAWMGVVRKR